MTQALEGETAACAAMVRGRASALGLRLHDRAGPRTLSGISSAGETAKTPLCAGRRNLQELLCHRPSDLVKNWERGRLCEASLNLRSNQLLQTLDTWQVLALLPGDPQGLTCILPTEPTPQSGHKPGICTFFPDTQTCVLGAVFHSKSTGLVLEHSGERLGPGARAPGSTTACFPGKRAQRPKLVSTPPGWAPGTEAGAGTTQPDQRQVHGNPGWASTTFHRHPAANPRGTGVHTGGNTGLLTESYTWFWYLASKPHVVNL